MSDALAEKNRSKRERWVYFWALLSLAAAVVLLWDYLSLRENLLGVRTIAVNFFFNPLLPSFAGHALLMAAIYFLFRRRPLPVVLFWLSTLLILALSSGWKRFLASAGMLLLCLIWTGMGRLLAGKLFPPESRHWSLSLGLGIAGTSLVVSYLAWTRLLYSGVLWLLLLLLLILTRKVWRLRFPGELREGWQDFQNRWSLGRAIALEGLFLLFVFLWVAASPPETDSDAVRFYWPYLKLLRAEHGFVYLPFQWSYIIPQAGLAYAVTSLLLVGEEAARWSMLACWLVLAGILLRCRKSGAEPDRSVIGASLALLFSSCPLLLSVTGSFMQDAFVCMVAAIMTMVALEGCAERPALFWPAFGTLIGLGWCAKYTLLAYAVPLGLLALFRSLRRSGLSRTLLFLPLGGVCSFLAAAPWLWNSYRQSQNPLFPFLKNFFPSPTWPYFAGTANLSNFQFQTGWKKWVLWPWDMTFHSDRYVEGYPGTIGLVLLVFVGLLIPAMIWRRWKESSFLFVAVSGTLLLWQVTPYMRYWLPGLWLLGLTVSYGTVCWLRDSRLQTGFALVCLALALAHPLFSMAVSWSDPKGWPWDYFSGRITRQGYLERNYPGFADLGQTSWLSQNFQRVWFTSYEGAGHLKVTPLDSSIWEMGYHVPKSLFARLRYLGSAGCAYWIVDSQAEHVRWYRALGLARFYWDDDSLRLRSGPVRVYQMKPVERIFQEIRALQQPGSDLMKDGDFEIAENDTLRFWMHYGEPLWAEAPAGSPSGAHHVVVSATTSWYQTVPVPAGVKKVELRGWLKAADPASRALARPQLTWNDNQGKTIGEPSQEIAVLPQWQPFSMRVEVPPLAESAVIWVAVGEKSPPCAFDDFHLVVE